ncbi:glycerol-3-phosphate 1-O-acyltransferase PlsY [Methylocapsa sp. S129]|uniref:glycerol-3-phosphate 1-O-acyltransferase PlsY n=1 Tax=Methylocapsa sp. S129 TaxID=1641869 RepID=UPI00131BAF05|nr:glycerol-3-phosphate 1-O-acyltransferase PlsY [Methylocapsa sp. S129]
MPFVLSPDDFFSLALGYWCGSIPFGLLLTRLAGTADLRTIGSGNIGATNVLRTGRKDLAAATLVLDALKGTLAVGLAYCFFGATVALFAAIGAFIGHLYPVWIAFRGGKGVATFLGCLIGIAWQAALVFALAWLAVAALTRYSSAAALTGSVLAPLTLYFWVGRPDAALVFALLALLLWIKHSANIGRLMNGTETRIGQGS